MKKHLFPDFLAFDTPFSGSPSSGVRRRKFILGASSVVAAAHFVGQQASAADLDTAMAPRVLGAADAPIQMAEYFSLSCSHCAAFHRDNFPPLKENWIDTGKLRFEYRDFPLRGPAIYAHALARSVPSAAYEGMLDILYKNQQSWVAAPDPVSALARLARLAGIGEAAFIEITRDRPLLEAIVAVAQDGYSRFEINSTPSFVINDRDVLAGNIAYAELDTFLSDISV